MKFPHKKIVIVSTLIITLTLACLTTLYRMSHCTNGCTLLQATTDANTPKQPETIEEPTLSAAPPTNNLVIYPDKPTQIILGSKDPNSNYMFELQLTSRGAAIENLTFSQWPNRDPKLKEQLKILKPVADNYSLQTGILQLLDRNKGLPLDKLDWTVASQNRNPEGIQQVVFEALVKEKKSSDVVLRITKTYTMVPQSYEFDCSIQIENLSLQMHHLALKLNGPVGINREGYRMDERKIVSAHKGPKNDFLTERIGIKDNSFDEEKLQDTLQLAKHNTPLLWLSTANKYFAAILVPQPEEGKEYAEWIKSKHVYRYNPDQHKKGNDEQIGLKLDLAPSKLGPKGSGENTQTYNFWMYVGPKDRNTFSDNPKYAKIGFIQAIDFRSCFCCPTALIMPISFAILGIFKVMVGLIGNYGVVIIIFVVCVRILMHPLMKKSQVSMSKFSKLAPKMEEIKKKYAGNQAEMNKKIMQLYRENGASPIYGMLPMFLQMPIWFALYTAINTSIDLRGAGFLPFWITDLSAPDALITWDPITIPVLGWTLTSLNLLPIMMGVAFFLQQKLMPSQNAAASTNPQMAQQQKMMMFMMPILFPIMLYPAPSGLNLYIMTSTFAGVWESYVIRKHIREKDETEKQGLVPVTKKTGGKVKKKKPKPFYRM